MNSQDECWYYHTVTADLLCKTCKNTRHTFFMLKSENEEENLSRDELIAEADSFNDFECDCGTTGNWLITKICIDNKDEIISQFKIRIYSQNDRVFGKPDDGKHSSGQVYSAFEKIFDKIEDIENLSFKKNLHTSPQDNGFAFILVDFINGEPCDRVTIFYVQGIPIEGLKMLLQRMYDDFEASDIKNWEDFNKQNLPLE